MRVSEKPWDAIEIDRGRTPWLIAVIAFLPMLLAYAVHFGLPPDGARGTGFLQSVQPMYMAAAIRHFEHGFFPAYGLPYSPDYDTPRVNVQLILLLLGSLVHLTGWDPGYVFTGFGIVAGVVMLRMAIALLTSFSGPMRGVAGMATCFLFLWGGGVLALSGLAWGLSKGLPFSYWSLREEVFRFDPFDGYWFLNLGRNVFYPLEAFFHCLFFGAILCVRHKKYLGGFILLIGAMLNHPFTALELSLVMGGIVGLEFILRVDPPPLWIVVAVGVSVPFFLLHSLYLVGLLSPEQTVVVAQNALDWSIDWKSMAAGYLPVVAIVILRFLRAPSLTGFLGQRDIRILLVWFGACFALINHDLIIKPHQPLHFTRGYVWTPLALLAAPIVYDLIARINLMRWRLVASGLVVALSIFAVFDNAMWFGRFYIDSLLGRSSTMKLPHDMESVFKRLSADDAVGSMVVSNDEWMRYLVVTYTPLRSWVSHPSASPYYERRRAQLEQFLADGKAPLEWNARKLAVVVRWDRVPTERFEWLRDPSCRLIDRIGRYDIILRDPLS